jgi:general secretion pathway protein B
MSLILDALKRAERERRGDAAPPPVVAMPTAGTPPRPRPRRWVAAAGAAVLALGAGAFFGWFSMRGAPAPNPPPAEATPAQATPKPEPQPILARPAPTPTVVPGTEGVASLDDLTDEAVLEAEPAAPRPAPVPAKPAPEGAVPGKSSALQTIPNAPTRAAEMRPAEPAATTPAPAQPTPAPQPAPQASAPAQEPPAEIPPALTQPAPLRKLREMPPDYRADFPRLNVEIHVYEKQAQRRFVMVNGRRYREGERMTEGPAVIEIVPEGMVLEHRGEKVLYTLGR